MYLYCNIVFLHTVVIVVDEKYFIKLTLLYDVRFFVKVRMLMLDRTPCSSHSKL
ncbi:unnamed protein product [Trifolium pratense]|uniref:Uncharacterized protein n=1 Tax=Trifolium pratense TaxID=57577 RepID=A0ACB0JI45_TRIPR|nr:unnamed protein product [Trifolium pratense]